MQRTLVKSPPELWAELSDPATLARHLGELGEIQIVRTEPDRAVDWEAAATDGAQASGRVEIEPSGWGTKVTLSASRMVVEPALEPGPEPEVALEAETEAEVALEAEAEPEVALEAKAEPEVALEAETEAVEVIAEPEPEPQIIEPEPRQGFFARFFRRRRQRDPEPEPEPIIEPEPTAEPEPEPAAATEIDEPKSEESSPEPDISAELAELEEQTTAVLTGVLDRLGAAHHRPFSRS
ncbi:MAG: hypothetical protein WB709_01380 [Solirubrobacteraceae bacterium]